jgi:hypothetical protein
MFSIVRHVYEEGRETLQGWAHDRNQTGVLPLLSIAAHLLHWLIAVLALVLLLWLTGERHWTR